MLVLFVCVAFCLCALLCVEGFCVTNQLPKEACVFCSATGLGQSSATHRGWVGFGAFVQSRLAPHLWGESNRRYTRKKGQKVVPSCRVYKATKRRGSHAPAFVSLFCGATRMCLDQSSPAWGWDANGLGEFRPVRIPFAMAHQFDSERDISTIILFGFAWPVCKPILVGELPSLFAQLNVGVCSWGVEWLASFWFPIKVLPKGVPSEEDRPICFPSWKRPRFLRDLGSLLRGIARNLGSSCRVWPISFAQRGPFGAVAFFTWRHTHGPLLRI